MPKHKASHQIPADFADFYARGAGQSVLSDYAAGRVQRVSLGHAHDLNCVDAKGQIVCSYARPSRKVRR